MPLSDNEIVEVYRQTVMELYGFVARRVGADRALAEDIVQETYCRAVAAWLDRGLPDQPHAWLCTVAGNLISSYFRRTPPKPIAATDLEQWMTEPGSTASIDAAALVQWGLARIRPDRARMLQSFYFDGRSIRQIAAEHNSSEKAIERRVARARDELRKRLKGRLIQHAADQPPKEVAGDAAMQRS